MTNIEDKNAEIQTSDEALEGLNTTMTEQKEELENTNSSIDETNQSISEVDNSLSNLTPPSEPQDSEDEAAMQRYEQLLSEYNSKKAELESQKQELESQKQELESQKQEQEEALKKTIEEFQKEEENNNALYEQLAQLQADLYEATNTSTTLDSEVAEYLNNYNIAMADYNTARVENSFYTNELAKAQANVSLLESKEASLAMQTQNDIKEDEEG